MSARGKTPRGLRVRVWFLMLLAASALGGLLFAHAHLMRQALRDPRFVRFLRRHDRRSALAQPLPARGRAVDSKGRDLVVTPGSALQDAVDDVAVSTGTESVALTLDAVLQTRARALLGDRHGAVVALEPCTGRVRVLVSSPTSPVLDRALNGLYPPGSTFKVFMAAAALTAGEDPLLDCPAAGYRFARGTPPIRDVEAYAAARKGTVWKGFGRLDMASALAHSSNVYFAQLGVRLGPSRFGEAIERARLRDAFALRVRGDVTVSATGNGIPEGASALQLAPMGIGQGALQISPLTVAAFTAAVANDGLMLEPTLSPTDRPTLRARPFSMAASRRVRDMMRRVVTQGTGRAANLSGLAVCGKTGTAETGRGRDHAWFTCFAPLESPRLVVTVLVEEGGFGAQTALPIAREMLLAAQAGGLLR